VDIRGFDADDEVELTSSGVSFRVADAYEDVILGPDEDKATGR
jgi:hypothetical protein